MMVTINKEGGKIIVGQSDGVFEVMLENPIDIGLSENEIEVRNVDEEEFILLTNS
ncbi:hypothetical protein [Candidatus Pristimantibacillus sp. PTI5]|uniref:hypothetical protein n=1 Tax=Candidatus Pristimantibacillus sp. PTI5 TaxID=3400422 RepID=UPI003B026C18